MPCFLIVSTFGRGDPAPERCDGLSFLRPTTPGVSFSIVGGIPSMYYTGVAEQRIMDQGEDRRREKRLDISSVNLPFLGTRGATTPSSNTLSSI